ATEPRPARAGGWAWVRGGPLLVAGDLRLAVRRHAQESADLLRVHGRAAGLRGLTRPAAELALKDPLLPLHLLALLDLVQGVFDVSHRALVHAQRGGDLLEIQEFLGRPQLGQARLEMLLLFGDPAQLLEGKPEALFLGGEQLFARLQAGAQR